MVGVKKVGHMAKVKKPTAEELKFHKWVMDKGCSVPDCQGLAVFHHVTVKPNYGGLAKPGPRRDHKYGAGLCELHHTKFHDVIGSVDGFYKAYGVQLELVADHNQYKYFKLVKISHVGKVN